MNTTPYKKLKTTLKNKLMGLAMADPRYYKCVEALEFAEKIHDGTRKDKKTKEFYHQLNMLGLAMTYHSLYLEPWKIYTCVILHDTYEDFDKFKEKHPELIDELYAKFPDYMEYIVRISKIRYEKNEAGEWVSSNIPYEIYFHEMSQCHVTSVVKGIDRFHNLSTMVGVFKEDKMLSYVKEVELFFLPMLKKARNIFTKQDQIYQSLKSILNVQCATVSNFIEMLKNQRMSQGDLDIV